MKIHEYQAKEFFGKFQIPFQQGKVIFRLGESVAQPEDVEAAAHAVSGSGPWIVKAQIHAGGRGKGGGVKFAHSLEEVQTHSRSIMGMRLITSQTGAEGKIVKRILISEAVDIAKEYYLAVTLDRAVAGIVIIASPAGGMDIEDVAKTSPDKIFKEWVEPTLGLGDFQCRRMSLKMGFLGPLAKEFSQMLKRLVQLFVECDCGLVEINPLVLNKHNHLVAIDAKISFDDNALFRHPSYQELVDPNEEDPNEAKADQFNLSYIRLDGNIGCMVNGAGLAMATMDIIKLEGGTPANFLDVGGSASEEKVREAFKIILQDKRVKAILVNIFGGIMKCDVIASGIVSAAKELRLTVPLVIRLEGTNFELGKKILEESSLKILTATTMGEAAQKAVMAAGAL